MSNRVGLIFWSIWRFFQLAGAIAVIYCYAVDLTHAHKEKKYTDGKWFFATFTGVVSLLTTLIYGGLMYFKSHALVSKAFAWDVVLAIAWIVVAGIFGMMYVNENPEMDTGVQRMKTAAYFDISNMVLWLFSATAATVAYCMGRKRESSAGY